MRLFNYYFCKKMRWIRCQISAIPHWLDSGWWIPHRYVKIEPANGMCELKDVYVSSRGIRLVNEHIEQFDDEILLTNMPIERYICKRCGKVLIRFVRNGAK